MLLALLISLVAFQSVTTDILIRNVNVVDVAEGDIRPDLDVWIRGGVIHRMGTDILAAAGSREIDGRNRYLIPGLWDMHVHLSKAGPSSLPILAAHGVLGVRDMGSDFDEITKWQAAIDDGRLFGPRILAAGPYLESQANVNRMLAGVVVEPVERTRLGFSSPADARRVVDSLASTGADFLKVRSWPDRETFLALAEAARERGLPLAGHTFFLEASDVLEAGLASIEHFMFPVMNDLSRSERLELFREMAARGTAVTPTLSTWYDSALLSYEEASAQAFGVDAGRNAHRGLIANRLLLDWMEQLEEKTYPPPVDWRQLLPDVLRNFTEMHAAGMTILPGTDLAVLNIYPGVGLHAELEYMAQELNMTPADVLRSATLESATWLGLEDRLGSVEQGKEAELVLLNGNPLSGISRTRDIAAIISGGVYRDRQQLDHILQGTAADLAAEHAFSGRYRLEASAGPQSIAVDLDLELNDFVYFGRMQIHLPSPVFVSLRSDAVEGDSVHFRASAPVVSVDLQRAGSDSVQGMMVLTGNRRIPLAGVRTGAPETSVSEVIGRRTPFESGRISTRNRGEAFITFTPDEDEVFFSSYRDDFGRQTIHHSKLGDDGWTAPEVAWFSGVYSDRSPALSPDGATLYFSSNRPLSPGGAVRGDFDLWKIERNGAGDWNSPERLASLSSEADDYQPCATDSGLWFISNREPGAGGQDVYRASFDSNGDLSGPVLLGPPINSDASEMSVFVNPTEEFMILATSNDLDGSSGNDDLYLLRRTAGGWGEPINLGPEVNSFANEYGAFVSREGSTLYYGSDLNPPADVYRVDISGLTRTR